MVQLRQCTQLPCRFQLELVKVITLTSHCFHMSTCIGTTVFITHLMVRVTCSTPIHVTAKSEVKPTPKRLLSGRTDLITFHRCHFSCQASVESFGKLVAQLAASVPSLSENSLKGKSNENESITFRFDHDCGNRG